MTWYVKALKTIEDLNAVTRTYREGCGLMILPSQLAESNKVHAHREGYSEVMSRVARENQGYLPIHLLQAAIANGTLDCYTLRACVFNVSTRRALPIVSPSPFFRLPLRRRCLLLR